MSKVLRYFNIVHVAPISYEDVYSYSYVSYSIISNRRPIRSGIRRSLSAFLNHFRNGA